MHRTQHEKIIDLCRDGQFHCQSEFWLISKSPHKRRGEIAQDRGYLFEERKCVHGIKNSKDFKMHIVAKEPERPPQVMPKYAVELVAKQLTLI